MNEQHPRNEFDVNIVDRTIVFFYFFSLVTWNIRGLGNHFEAKFPNSVFDNDVVLF